MLEDLRSQQTRLEIKEWKSHFPTLLRYSNVDGKTLLRVQGKHSLWERTALVEFTEVHSPLLIEVQHAGMVPDDPRLNVVRLNLPHIWQYMTVSALLRSAARAGEVTADFDLEYLGEALLAPLQVDYFRFQRQVRGYSTERIAAGLAEMVGLLAM